MLAKFSWSPAKNQWLELQASDSVKNNQQPSKRPVFICNKSSTVDIAGM